MAKAHHSNALDQIKPHELMVNFSTSHLEMVTTETWAM